MTTMCYPDFFGGGNKVNKWFSGFVKSW